VENSLKDIMRPYLDVIFGGFSESASPIWSYLSSEAQV